ncbi:MAG: hypothetical protein AAB215_08615, partial [Planctomycetota bacterium]
QAGIEATPDGIEDFLKKEMGPAPEPGDPAPGDEKISALIAKLGHDEFSVREAAMKDLRKIGKAALRLLKEATGNADPEIRSRAQDLVDEIEGGGTAGKGALHDAAMYVLLTGGSPPDVAETVADFWPRFRGSAQGRTWMISMMGQAAMRLGNPPGADKLKMLDRLIGVLETPGETATDRRTATTLLMQTTGQRFTSAGEWRRWHRSSGGKPPKSVEDKPPENSIVLNLGLKTLGKKPSIEVAGKAVETWDAAGEALKAEAERLKKEGKAATALVRFNPSVDPEAIDAVYGACATAGIKKIQLRPVRKGETDPGSGTDPDPATARDCGPKTASSCSVTTAPNCDAIPTTAGCGGEVRTAAGCTPAATADGCGSVTTAPGCDAVPTTAGCGAVRTAAGCRATTAPNCGRGSQTTRNCKTARGCGATTRSCIATTAVSCGVEVRPQAPATAERDR